jgi:GNAT superfamily N-acetyltransferase
LGVYPLLTKGPITFEQVDGADLPKLELRDLHYRAFPDGFSDNFGASVTKEGRLVVARAPRTYIAYSLWLPPPDDLSSCWYLDTVGVIPERRGEGVGSELVRRGARWLLGDGVETIRAVPLGGDEEDRRTRWLHQLGFRSSGSSLLAEVSVLVSATG